MTEDEIIEKMTEIATRYERVIVKQAKQRDYLLAYVARLVLPTQLNAILEKLKEIENE
jgi:hypothetical protein